MRAIGAADDPPTLRAPLVHPPFLRMERDLVTDHEAPQRIVWKYELGGSDNFLDLPRDAQILHVATQAKPYGGNGIFMWAQVDANAPLRRRRFYVVGTGHALPPDAFAPIHLGSFLTDSQGTYVFHVFESLDAKMASAMAAQDGGQADG